MRSGVQPGAAHLIQHGPQAAGEDITQLIHMLPLQVLLHLDQLRQPAAAQAQNVQGICQGFQVVRFLRSAFKEAPHDHPQHADLTPQRFVQGAVQVSHF